MSRFQSAIEVCSKERIQVIAGARRIQSICSTAMFFSYCVHAFLETISILRVIPQCAWLVAKKDRISVFSTTGSHSNPTAGIGLFTSYIWLQLPPLRNWSVKAWRHQFEHQNPLKYLLPKRTPKAVWKMKQPLICEDNDILEEMDSMSSRDVVGAQNFVGPLANTAKTVSLCWKKKFTQRGGYSGWDTCCPMMLLMAFKTCTIERMYQIMWKMSINDQNHLVIPIFCWAIDLQ